MSDYSPIFSGQPPYTSTASATITGGQLLEATTTGKVGPAAAGSVKVVGVAAFDAAANALVTIHRGGVQELTAPAGVTVGQTLKAAAAGTVATWVSGTDAADLIVGRALTTAGTGALAQVLLFI